MRILMLGNSFIFVNDLPSILADLTGAEVVSHTRGGARLAEQINPNTKMGAKTLAALENEHWDYVVLQEMSKAPAITTERFLETAHQLCDRIKAAGAKPVFYATWAYQPDSQLMSQQPFTYEEMYQKLHDAYYLAAEQNDALIADVGTAFFEKTSTVNLYDNDGCHPNLEGTRLAAQIIADTIMQS